MFFLRLGQRIVHLLTMHSAAGRLYEVDMRLRPNGKGGFLMTGIDAFEQYQHQEAWTWEHQALLRARAVAGDAGGCARRFEEVRRARAMQRDAPRDACARTCWRCACACGASCRRADPAQFDIKQDAGGIADIEFLVQYWVLASAAGHPRAGRPTRTTSASSRGSRRPRSSNAETAQWLKETYIGYRTILHHLSLEGGRAWSMPRPHAAAARQSAARYGAKPSKPVD